MASKDKALEAVVKMEQWAYLFPLMELKPIYREMKQPQHRHRQPGGQKRKNGTLQKNQQRLGPLTLEARTYFSRKIIDIQCRVNASARKMERPEIDILNLEELKRIQELIRNKTYPQGWTGNEPTGDVILDKVYSDGSVMPYLFRDMVNNI